MSVSKAIRNGSIDTGFANAEYSNRFIGNGRMCINPFAAKGLVPDVYGRLVNPNTINTFVPGCNSANYMVDRENIAQRQFWLSSLSPDALITLGETVDPKNAHYNYSASSDLLNVRRDASMLEPIKVQFSAEDQANFGQELDMACRANKRGLQRPTICPDP